MAGAGPLLAPCPLGLLQWCNTAPWGKVNRETAVVSKTKKTLSLDVFSSPSSLCSPPRWAVLTGEMQKGLFAAALLNRPNSHLLFLLGLFKPTLLVVILVPFPFLMYKEGNLLSCYHFTLFKAQEGNFGFVPNRQEV